MLTLGISIVIIAWLSRLFLALVRNAKTPIEDWKSSKYVQAKLDKYGK